MQVVLGIGGGIAAYKSAELVRALQQQGHTVQAVMTDAAQQFVTPLTLTALTGKRVISDLFAQGSPDDALASSVEHIGVAQQHDLLVVAPATADILGKFAYGLADDFLSTMHLAFNGPVVLAPAMNDQMWAHPAVKLNVETLRARGYHFVDPEEGWLACGSIGAGRLADVKRIAEIVERVANPRRDLAGETVLVTAGPTHEPLDPVRYIGNRSSGKMGYAIAKAAADRGARVVLVSGPVSLSAPAGVEVHRVKTALEMHDAVLQALPEATIIIKAAAVADYSAAQVAPQKIKKTAARVSLELHPTPDILAELGRIKGDRILVGFAAETENLFEEAKRKLEHKNCDMLVANLVNQEDGGFESDDNKVTIFLRSGKSFHFGPASKIEVAGVILDQMQMLRLTMQQVDASSVKA